MRSRLDIALRALENTREYSDVYYSEDPEVVAQKRLIKAIILRGYNDYILINIAPLGANGWWNKCQQRVEFSAASKGNHKRNIRLMNEWATGSRYGSLLYYLRLLDLDKPKELRNGILAQANEQIEAFRSLGVERYKVETLMRVQTNE